jgi:molecular chaperone DnaK (HSP70)
MIGSHSKSAGNGHRSDIDYTFELVSRALKGAEHTPEQIDDVLLVGGSSCIPMIRRRLIDMFGEKKVRMNIDPMKCVAFGAAILAASLGEQWQCACGHLNPGSSDVCGKCGEGAIRQIGMARVTAMHYGIEALNDKFEIVIPKGSPYPSPSPVVQRFKTASQNARRLKIRVRAGLNEVASKNELQQTVWLGLPDNTPENTPVDVALKLSDDGVLDHVKVSLRDGSGREVEAFRDRGGERRSRVEKRIEAARHVLDEKRRQAPRELVDKGEELYEQAIKAVGDRHDLDVAEKHLQELGKLFEQPVAADWKRATDNTIGLGEFGLREFGHYLEANESFRIKKLIDDLRQTMVANQEQPASEKSQELLKALFENENQLFSWFMSVGWGISVAGGAGDARLADRLRSALRAMEETVRRVPPDIPGMQQIVRETEPVLAAVFSAIGQPVPHGSGWNPEGGIKR